LANFNVSLQLNAKQHQMKQLSLIFSLLWLTMPAFGQYNCWMQFTDKKGTSGSLSNPSAYLSERAIARRTHQQIAIDSTDLPVSSPYIQKILNLGATRKSSSKWMNGITVVLSDTSLLKTFRALPFVKKTTLTLVPSNYTAPSKTSEIHSLINDTYGNAYRQIDMHNGRKLHTAGFRGKGMLIGVLDAGFYKTDQIDALDSLRAQNRLLGTHDFADPSVSFFSNTESHGTNVLSTMAANLPDQMIGTAPDASYWLIRTEYSPTEYSVETDNWVAGVEFADSVGVDIINSSLGDTTFDYSGMNYSYQSLNGQTSRASVAATMAARKGMIVVNADGNEGANTWHYISVPSDADSIITVGAIDYNGAHASFSGYGPTADGRIKPDVCAVGYQSVIASSSNTITTGNGTSFASPIMAGLIACLWQALPSKSNMEIINLLRKYSSLYSSPDNTLGYGIPDVYALFSANYVALTTQQESKSSVYLSSGLLKIDDLAVVQLPANATLYAQTGQKIAEWSLQTTPTTIALGNLSPGFYILSIANAQTKEVFKLINH
jgi:serine protease AprX